MFGVVLLGIIVAIVSILQIVLFFKAWRMCDDVHKITKLLEKNPANANCTREMINPELDSVIIDLSEMAKEANTPGSRRICLAMLEKTREEYGNPEVLSDIHTIYDLANYKRLS